MNKYVVLIYSDPELLGQLAPEQFNATMRDCLAHADELRTQGRLLDTQMLADAGSGKSIRVREGKRSVMDGPFTETKELLAGFNLIEAEDMDAALEIARTFPWAETGCVEVREILDVADVRRQVGA